ncbi:CYTH domain-containing protein [Oceanobacillus alkalisoli]|uniref:CYTH domain-containing protein n=1 Tax=Oceanobacillus alkalisoli TaxID=2925113 RepID=UPI001EF0F2B0|nr:CYTH domain-containing protein [Oceanobacillus alkalisoli]MCF3942084.1 CYTH domain-containing protein [Oceanobacillus alkalisoli]MCG5105055.1 CYTH domain-containing protein [Oceanobacillus alkalisoli]
MAQEIEIEFKNLLTKAEFDTLLETFPFPKEPIKQTNHYFETENLELKKHHSALRIREKNGEFTLTLKEPFGDSLLETHDQLTQKEAASWLNGKPAPKKNVGKQLEQLEVDFTDLKYFGELSTERWEYQNKDTLYVLDYSTYNEQDDYEFELEAKSRPDGEKVFKWVLETNHIPKRRTPNKIERFFMNLKNLDGKH